MAKSENKGLHAFLWLLRIAVGGLFIFSGLVKANDPKGLAYKMGEFFEAWAIHDQVLPDLMNTLNEYALHFAILMIIFEIVAGVALIIGYRFRLFSILIFLLTAFFTFLTAYVLFSGNIKACGCFGDCIPLTPKETFTKDIILMVLISILLLFRKRIKELFSFGIGTLIIVLTLIISWWMMSYVQKHLPFKDCLAYAKGNNIINEMTEGPDYKPAVYASHIFYKNRKTGKTQEFDANNLPWKDSLNWAFDTTINELISEAVHEPRIKDFSIADFYGTDITQDILNYEQNIWILFVKDVHKTNAACMDQIKQLSQQAKKNHVPFLAVFSSSQDEVEEYYEKYKLEGIDPFVIDGTVCKTALRSDPGLMLLQKGVIKGKWGYADFSKAVNQNIKNTQNARPVIEYEEEEESTDSTSPE